MRQPRRLSSRQLALSLECETTIRLSKEAREEVINALADLLLEAFGEVPSKATEDRNESEN